MPWINHLPVGPCLEILSEMVMGLHVWHNGVHHFFIVFDYVLHILMPHNIRLLNVSNNALFITY